MKRKNSILIGLLMLTCACSSVTKVDAESNSEYWDSFNLKEEYVINDSIYLDDVAFNIGNVSKMATATLKFPSGKVTDSQSNILNESGKYEVTYSTIIDGKYYEKTQEFFVATPYVSHGTNSSTYYGVGNKATHPGLVVKLAKNDVLNFNEIVDLSDLTKDDELLRLYMTPSTHGSNDLNTLIFRFTDIADTSNYLEITIGKRAWKPEAYPGDCAVFGKGDDSDRVSAEGWTNGLPNGGGAARGYVNANSSYGAMMDMTMNGIRIIDTKANYGYRDDGTYGWMSRETAIVSDTDYDTTEGIITYDYAGMELGLVNMKMDYKGARTHETNYKKVWDFDDPVTSGLVVGGYGTWRGFTSGKCRLTIRGEQYESNYANFVLTGIHGIDLKQEILNDIEGPEISINSPLVSNGKMTINGKAGCFYTIPEVSSVDQYSGVSPVNTNVFLNYGTENQINADMVGGRFFPKVAGTYTIEYKSSDTNGNISIKTIDVVIDEASPSDISLDFDGDPILSAKQGRYYYLPNVKINGGLGDKTVKAYGIFNKEKFEITNGSFIPEKSGNYIIRIECTDFIGQVGTVSYNLSIEANDEPFILDAPVLAPYYLAGGRYEVPSAVAFKYVNNEKTSIVPTAKVEYKTMVDSANESDVTLDLNMGETFSTANVKDNGNLKISYYYEGILLGSYDSKTINQIYYDEQNYQYSIDFKKYFISDSVKNVEYDLSSDDNGYKFISKGEDYNVDFANKLLIDKFYLGFVVTQDNLFDSMKVTLKDSTNLNNSISLVLTLNADKTFTVTCGDNTANTRLVSLNSETNRFGISFDGTSFNIGDGDTIIKVNKMDNGKEYNSFDSHFVYANFEINGLEADDFVCIKKIGNHEFVRFVDFSGNVFEPMNDYVEPQLSIEGDLGKYGQINEKASTDQVFVQDVFAPTSIAKVTVSKDSKTFINDVNGMSINNLDASKRYDFIFTKTEVYTAKYVVNELSENQAYWVSENKKNVEYTYGVIDTLKPIITLTSLMHTVTNVGGTLALSTFKVSDNVSSAENITVIREMILPSGRFNEIGEGITRYKFNESGEYEFRIVAIDEAMNVSMYSTFINVL